MPAFCSYPAARDSSVSAVNAQKACYLVAFEATRPANLKSSYAVNPAHLERRMDRAAAAGHDTDFVHAVTRQGLFDRLEPMQVEASVVLDLGCGSGSAIASLEKRFRGARVVGVERSMPLLARAARRRRWLSRSAYLQALPDALPLAAHSADVVFSNLGFAALGDPATLAAEVNRVLRKDGLFLFATLGPDSLGELRRAWAAVDDEPHVQRFPDMHDLGDLLVRAGLRDPVLDVDRLTLEFATTAALFRDLTGTGARNCLAERRRTLTGMHRFRRMTESLETARREGVLRISLELVFGHCWGSGQVRESTDVRIDPAAIRVRRRGS